MKINNFIGKKINEYIDLNIKFNNDLSIIVGPNGSGKTTALNLIHSILCPNLEELIKIPYKLLQLEIQHLSETYSIEVHKDKTKIEIHLYLVKYVEDDIYSFSSVTDKLIIDFQQFEEMDYMKYKNKSEINYGDLLLRKYNAHEIITFIKNLSSPIFVGLERTNSDVKEDYKNYLLERNLYLHNKAIEIDKYRRTQKNTLGVSILETELLIQSIYKRLKSVEEHYSNSIQKELIYSSFEYIDFNLDSSTDLVALSEKYKLVARQSEIEESLKKIGILDKNLSNKLKLFFSNIEKLLMTVKGVDFDNSQITIEWLLNKSQIDKLSKLVEILDVYKSKVQETFAPITKFLNIINSFFKDTGKRLYVDEVGRLSVKKPHGRDLTVDELSSGERQLIILFANVIFDKYKFSTTKNEIMIIDEPEISLHIRWQEKFIDCLYEASEKTQFIIATHSPDIIGDYKADTIKLNSNN
ncbi:hypothetical protein OA93_13490 [Flavobacterium sp. KMS]|uniref:AAA family ATPase n=1 Tax=Flavobacterium sp. KMS TaxID=1566023 RepID=UPI00057C4E2A|nr:AAA family ATPase [Flavobacterium sp. KMS]KIA97538.1 hypothetical protein OA93_13490 [Flavobacterium sp. KMS]